MWPLISPASGACGFLHLGLDQAVAGLPHQRLAAELGDAVVQHLRRLHVGDDRRAGLLAQHGYRQNGQKLIAPDHAALAVDRADAVAVAVESHSEIEVVVGDKPLQVGEILFFGRIGMMVGEIAVYLGEDRVVLTRQQLHELLDHAARRAVARVPADPEGAAGIARHQPADIIVLDIGVGDGASSPSFPVAVRRHAAQFLDVLAEKRQVLKHHLEAVILGGIVAAGYLDAAIHF